MLYCNDGIRRVHFDLLQFHRITSHDQIGNLMLTVTSTRKLELKNSSKVECFPVAMRILEGLVQHVLKHRHHWVDARDNAEEPLTDWPHK